MEYLMTYGWAILVVIIVGIVLWQSGVFGTGSGGVSGFDKVRVEDYVFDSSNITVSFENAAGQTMRQVDIQISINGAAYEQINNTAGGNATNWAPGKEYAYTLAETSCSSVGAGYTADFSIAYNSEANLAHTETGTIRGECE